MHQPAPLTTAFAFADTAHLEGLALHSATTTTNFALADTARLEGLAFYFGDDYYDLRPRRHI